MILLHRAKLIDLQPDGYSYNVTMRTHETNPIFSETAQTPEITPAEPTVTADEINAVLRDTFSILLSERPPVIERCAGMTRTQWDQTYKQIMENLWKGWNHRRAVYEAAGIHTSNKNQLAA